MVDALMFSLFGLLFAGPLFFSIVGGVILHKKFGSQLFRSIAFLILGLLFYAGLFMSTLKYSPSWGFSSFGVEPHLENVRVTLFALTLGWYVILIVSILPFVHMSFLKEKRDFKTSAKSALYAGSAVFAGLIFASIPATNTTLLFPDYTADWLPLLPGESFDLYFISEGKVFRTNLTSQTNEELSNATEEGSELFFRSREKGETEILIRNLRGEVPLLKTKVSERLIASDFGEQEALIGYKPTAETFVAPALQLATPLMRWLNGRDNMFPGGEIIFEIGQKIFVYNWKMRKISFLRNGTSPLLILKPEQKK
jgi:hypothetical protein